MSFLSKWKSSTLPAGQAAGVSSTKKDPNAPQPTLLEQRLADATGPVRTDGSDKFFGFENYGSTCYCNSIIQCLYYSAPFRENVLNFPSHAFLEDLRAQQPNGKPLPPSTPSVSSYPNVTSPARKPAAPTSPGGITRPEDSKDSPEYKKRQALASGPVLDMTQDNSVKYGMGESLFTSLRDIFEAIIGHQSRIGVVSPHRFLEILRRENEMFRSAMHQDAHEFLNLLLNQVMDNVESFSKQYPSALTPPVPNGSVLASRDHTPGLQSSISEAHWVHDLFEGQLTSETRCLTCENTSQRDEAFLDLSVDLSPHTSVTSCLRKFSEEEMLCERNKFHCDNCGGLQEAEKRMKIKRLPRILALHLKRFKYTEDLQRLQKLFHRVVYPFYLRLFNTTDDAEDPDRLYELYAVVVHIGGGPYHGHYVSIIKTQDRGWLLFDDEMVEPVDQSYVLNFFGGEPVPGMQDAKQLACAYVLFYQETTLEAMLRAQAADGGTVPTAAPVRVSDAETAKDGLGSPLYHTNTIVLPNTPSIDDSLPLEHLAHAATAPHIAVRAPAQPHLDHPATALGSPPLTTTTPQLPSMPAPKSKKELKQEEKERKAGEKERKAEEKARQKAEERANLEQKQAGITRRHEAWRRADEEMRQVVEHSRVTAAEEARMRASSEGTAPSTAAASTALTPAASEDSAEAAVLPNHHVAGVKQKESGLARFRHGSMSLRSKPRLFSSSKDKEKGLATTSTSTATATATAVPGTNGAAANGMNGITPGKQAGVSALPSSSSPPPPLPPPPGSAALPPLPPEKKSRFSLGRKKSTALSRNSGVSS